jgi:PAS domain S-box-containing protein
MITAGGRVLWLKDFVSVVVENDKVEKLRGVMVDISSQKQAEAQLELLAQAIRSVNESVSISNLDDIILFVNDAFLKTYGYEEADLLGKNIAVVGSPNNDPEVLREILRSTHRSGWQGELLNLKKDGTEFPVRLSTSIVRDQNGRPSAIMRVASDISERRLLEDQLRQSQKMEAIGRLAGGIAHDFNNLLTAILGYSGLLLNNARQDDPQRNKLQEIQKAGERAALLTQQLLAFSRKQVLAPQVLDLNELVHDTESMLRRIIGEDIAMATIFDPALCHIRADRNQVEQVILNLVVNARDAMSQGGQLVIETENVEVEEAYAHSHPELPQGNYAMLVVSDSGIGMDRQTQAHIFEPFFTTKEEGRGTGLGLSTVYGIVKQNGGQIFVDSEPGHGSTFRVYFPRCLAPREAVAPAKVSDLKLAGSEVVLLVEDETSVRDLIHRVLASYGYTVLEAASGEEGLNLAERYSGVIDLVLTDIVLPKMSGREMADRLKASRESIRVLYVSGYTEETISHNEKLDDGIAFLAKPFSSQVLLRKVREVLSA